MSLERQTLRGLVRQFARPLDCLRELVQNSLDAGAPRVDIALDAAEATDTTDAADAMSFVRLVVDDRGAGMDEQTIDDFLTTLFASTKEGDLTRIGRYGVGFVSVFALDPHAVIVQTGRAGQSWVVRFDAEWNYEKVRAEDPHVGTRVTLLLRRPTATVRAFADEVRAALLHWCEHAPRPIWFVDGTSEPAVRSSADPFGPFREAQPAELISRPLDLPGCPVVLRVERADVIALIGACEDPTFSVLRHGLTLARSDRPDLLGEGADRLAHLAIKVDSARLEHRISRDAVIHDEAWRQVLDALIRAAAGMGEALLSQASAEIAAGRSAESLYRLIERELRATSGHLGADLAAAARQRPIWSTDEGPTSLDALAAQERSLGGVLIGTQGLRLQAELRARGLRLLHVGRDGRSLLAALPGPPGLLGLARRGACRPIPAAQAFVLLLPLPPERIRPAESRALAAAERALRSVSTRPRALRLVEASAETPFTGLVPPLGRDAPTIIGPFDPDETLVLRDHPLVQAAAALTHLDEALAGQGLAHGILLHEPDGHALAARLT